MPLYQVFTGKLPYDNIRDSSKIIYHITSGERPNRNRWLQESVWDMITTCWSEDPDRRWEVPAVCDLFSTLSLQEVRNVRQGNWNKTMETP